MNDRSETSEQYRQVQVETSTTLDLVQMAYDGIIDNLNQAAVALQTDSKSYDTFNEKMSKAQQIVSALEDGLDTNQGELSTLLADFYIFLRKRLIESNMEKSLNGVEELVSIVHKVQGSWKESATIRTDSDHEVEIGQKRVDVTN